MGDGLGRDNFPFKGLAKGRNVQRIHLLAAQIFLPPNPLLPLAHPIVALSVTGIAEADATKVNITGEVLDASDFSRCHSRGSVLEFSCDVKYQNGT